MLVGSTSCLVGFFTTKSVVLLLIAMSTSVVMASEEGQTECGRDLAGPAGTITAPSYSTHLHRDSTPPVECSWRVTAPVGHVITLEFEDLVLEGKSGKNCGTEFMHISDGSPAVKTWEFCAHEVPPTITTVTNVLILHYKTKGSHMLGESGFKARYTTQPPAETDNNGRSFLSARAEPSTNACPDVNLSAARIMLLIHVTALAVLFGE